MANGSHSLSTDLYRFYAADGTLLYVGISKSAIVRMIQHATDKQWWDDVARIDVERILGPRKNAERAERTAIALENPKHNIAHKGSAWRYPKEPSEMTLADLKRDIEKTLIYLQKAEVNQRQAIDMHRERIYDALKMVQELQERIRESERAITGHEGTIESINKRMSENRIKLHDIADGLLPV